VSRCSSPVDLSSLVSNGLDRLKTIIPLVSHKSGPDLMWRMPGALVSNGSSSSGSKGRKGKGKKSKEISIAYGPQVKVPGINKHISGLQKITIQATQQDTDAVNTSTTVPVYNAQYFTLASNVPNYTSYTSIFDEYKIDMVEIWVSLPGLAPVASTVRGEFSTAVDYDDANTPTSISTVSDKQNSLTTTIDQSHYHKWQPKFAVGAYSSTFVSFASETGWLDCGSPNVQHYGFKFAASQTAGGVEFVQYVVRLTVSFRSPGIS